ncbi:MAG: DUF2107 family protein [Methanoculleaceae archaeon]
MKLTIALGLVILAIGTLSASFPVPRSSLTRLINIEIASWGLLLIMLAYAEMLAVLTFTGVTAISTFVLVRIMERSGAI